jgi:phosphate starvation-inducible PhoH-like protein
MVKKTTKKFHLELLNSSQKLAYQAFQQHDVTFLSGPAGTGKTTLAICFAIQEILIGTKDKIILTRPIVEAGESLGYLPGDLLEKVDPYMRPFTDALHKMLGKDTDQRIKVDACIEVVPLAFMRGRSIGDAICILDEAQNTTFNQLKLFLTRFEETSKLIIAGDPEQSDLGLSPVPLVTVLNRLENVKGIGMVQFNKNDIMRHPLVTNILESLG